MDTLLSNGAQEEESPKPRLTRIRSLLNSESAQGETLTSKPHAQNCVGSLLSSVAHNRRLIRGYREALDRALKDRSRDPNFPGNDQDSSISASETSPILAASQPLSEYTASSLSRQPTLELADMGDSAEKPPLVRRKSSRMAQLPPDSLPLDELCAPAMSRSKSSSSVSLSRSGSKSMSRTMSKSVSRSTSVLSRSASTAKANEVGDIGDEEGDAAPDTPSLSRTGSTRMSRSLSKRTLSKTASTTTALAAKSSDIADASDEEATTSPTESDAAKDASEEPMEVDADPVPVPGPSSVAGPSDPFGPSAIELVISFDTTGSMSSCIGEVRNCVQEVIQRLFMDIPNLKISIIAHGDYCDERTYYLLKQVDFTNDVASLCQFVRDVEGSGGGDFDECYEYVLHHVRNKMKWTPGTQRALVMIGDATPHEPEYNLNKLNLNWRDEANKLHDELGVRIYAVQCQNNGANVTKFYQSLADRTQGRYLRLDKFSTIVDILMAICYREKGAEFFEVSTYSVVVNWLEVVRVF